MKASNHVQLIGNLGKDPELKEFESGSSVCEISVATTDVYKNKAGEKKSTTQWHSVIAWNTLGLIISKNFKKGSKILITGSIDYQSYEKDGEKKFVTKIIANSFEFIDSKQSENSYVDKPEDFKEEDDDIPF